MLQRLLLVSCFLGSSALFAQTPTVQSVLNAADYSSMIAPGVWVAIFGTSLAPTSVTNTTLPLPSQLGGVTVTITRGTVQENAPLRYVSSTQINALLPFDLATGSYNLAVSSSSGTSAAFPIQLSTVAPAIYTKNAAGTGPALAFDGNFNAITSVTGSPLVLYASGLGPTNPPGTAAGGNSTEPLNRTTTTPLIRIGGQLAQVGFSGLAPGLPGIYQLNVTPSSTAPSDNSLTVQFLFPSGSVTGAVTTLPVAAGANVANVTGKITPTYPVSATVLGYSALLTAAKFNLAFDIPASAKPFNVVASCPGGSMTIALNPAAGTWQATASVPTSAMRFGDFSSVTNFGGVITILDFANNNFPFPANVIPASRLDPVALQATSAIPLPNTSGSTNLLLQGTIPAGGHFVVSDASNSTLANFGNFTYVTSLGSAGLNARTNACSLTVDGALIDSSMVTFQ